MKSGTFTNNTSFSATAAQVNVPTGSISVGDNDRFTVPSGVKVIKVYFNKYEYDDTSGKTYTYVGVTPGKTYIFNCYSYIIFIEGNPDIPDSDGIYLGSVANRKKTTWFNRFPADEIQDYEYLRGFELSWSPEINKMTPTYTDY